ncbi:Outer membrane receptor for ferric coprogen and ferric-rhodotorulic acid [Lysobacter capsici AZ78]|uniref:Outer membrane receptor for ferric coprogen and ferric-rhodotorulic acid n=1 Tax=Lysobacter capsici AZ78 TaxID=1444315 RepID=A0A120AFI0_9GAMM|nr:putative porin [Lysobacter capsici]KWS03035.1 Outer membrane receptor for ferric coprogen and ferric-rhodotorulic acid [Lysobacter capsici AZ78]
MTVLSNPHRRLTLSALTLALAALCMTPALAAPPVDASKISPEVTLKLIDLLVAKGVMTREQADDLIAEASASAASKPATAVAAQPAYQTAPGAVVVPYIPEVVRQQIKDELRAEVTQQAKSEGWAAPNALPEWTQRISVYGDLRARAEDVLNDGENYNDFPNFGVLNAGSGYDVNDPLSNPLPTVNTTKNRGRMRMRARLGVHAQIADWVEADLRMATGSDRSPVSTNQTLGAGGNLSKYSLWLDRAYLRLKPTDWLTADIGRAPNPFWTSELLFDTDLGFDGVAVKTEFDLGSDFHPYVNLGAFPIFNTDFDFGSTQRADKASSRDKWLYGVQAGADWKFSDDVKLKFGLGYFLFDHINGERSSPCIAPTSKDVCDTDLSRPQFQQFGNTMFAIRDIVPASGAPDGPQLQYFGYASEFGVANLHAALEIASFDPVKIVIEADVVKNLKYDAKRIQALGPLNNFKPNIEPLQHDGGDSGYYVNLLVGQPKIAKAWDWNASIGYKRLESDAVPDAFTDSDFHLGGTNARGFIVGGSLGLARNTWLGLRWLSANEVTGAPYSVDVVQLDLSTEF